ncbi:hypothetical protein C2G38_2184637 [Gigaspora rosea]|uniref:Uncharacterized protein n=1 Tax=Gigaspora rosea TaxID=44941 RepID=A0A397V8M1_9GLOM|nr:hypothetical protein C2G38_2184637 [Gigaspora rosea]
MSKNKKYTVKLVNKGQINSNLYYSPYARDWWIPDLKTANNSVLNLPFRLYMSVITVINNQEFFLSIINNPLNPLQPGFLCSVGEKFSDVQNTPSTAVNLLYQELFGSQTEHLGLAVLGFYNEKIILEILADISVFPLFIKFDKFTIVVSKIGYSSREDLLYAGPGYTSSLLTCHGSETYLILQQVLDDHCSLRVYKSRNEVHQYVGETPTVVWEKYGMHKNKDYLAFFELKDPALLTNKEDMTSDLNRLGYNRQGPEKFRNEMNEHSRRDKSLSKGPRIPESKRENDTSALQQIFDLHVKRRKIPMPNEDWHILFTKWIAQQSRIVQLPHVLHSVYPPGYSFQHRELAAWRSMFLACGCTDIMPYSKEESDVEFWTCAVDPRADRQTLKNLYHWDLIQIPYFSENKLPFFGQKVTSKTISKARKHFRLYGAGAPPIEMPKKTIKLMPEFKERQFEIFFSDKENVTMSSYKTDPKTNLPILYLYDNKTSLWKKFQQTFPNGIKKTSFMGRIADCKNLKYQSNLGGLCGICNDYGFESFENLIEITRSTFTDKIEMNEILSQIEQLRRHFKRDFEQELIITLDGKISHDPCIDHCLTYAFGKCTALHFSRCSKCERFYKFFDQLENRVVNEYIAQLHEIQERLKHYLGHQVRKTYLNAQFKAMLSQLKPEGTLIVANYKMRVFPKSACKTKKDFFGKRGWTLHTILVFTKIENQDMLDVQAYDHWSTDTKQDAWFTTSSFEAVFDSMKQKPKWITVISDNGAHYHNSELMTIIAHWNTWYSIKVKRWLFLEPGEAKTTIDSHHANVIIKRYVRVGFDLTEGVDIVEAAKGLSGTLLAEIKINRDDRKFNASLIRPKPIVSAHTEPISDWTMPIPTIKVPSNNIMSEDIEMENFNDDKDYDPSSGMEIEDRNYFLENNVETGEQDAFIRENSDGIEVEMNKQNSFAHYQKSDWMETEAEMNEHRAFINFQKSAETGESSRIGVKMNKQNAFICHQKSARMENSNRIGVKINEQNTFFYYQKSVETDNTSERNIEEAFQLSKGWASSTNAKFRKKGGGKRIKPKVVNFLKQFFLNGNLNPKDKMTAKEMQEELLKFVDSGEIEKDHMPKVTTIQNWIGRYSREFNQQGTAIALETFKAASSPNEEN